MSQRDNDQHTADQWSYHMAAISRILEQWRDADITTFAKRRAIADENSRYYGDSAEPWMTRTGRRYELPAVLADAAGIPEEAVTMALNAYRHAGPGAYADVIRAAAGSSR